MIKYNTYISYMLDKKYLWDVTYREIGEATGMTKQNAHKILNCVAMGSTESYMALESYFGINTKFEKYRRQFKTILIGFQLEYIADKTGLSKLCIINILDCNVKGQPRSYELLEKFIEEQIYGSKL